MTVDTSGLKQAIQEKYGAAARNTATGGCCGPAACGDPITSNLYSDTERSAVPAEAASASLGCGNPTALIELRTGETVLDLGSGGGIDVLLSAKRVGASGKVYGPDKDRVLREAFRVLKPGGRFAVSDVVARGDVAPAIRKNVEAWIGCVAGALGEHEYRSKLQDAGFDQVEVETWRVYDHVDAPGTFASAFVRATKPSPQPCCGTECCK